MGNTDILQSKFLGSLPDSTIRSFNFQSGFHASAKLAALNLPALLKQEPPPITGGAFKYGHHVLPCYRKIRCT